MIPKTFSDFIDKISDRKNLDFDSLQGVADALGKILAARNQQVGGGGMPNGVTPPPLDIDPELPNISGGKGSDDNEIDYNDPDDLRSKQKQININPDDIPDDEEDEENKGKNGENTQDGNEKHGDQTDGENDNNQNDSDGNSSDSSSAETDSFFDGDKSNKNNSNGAKDSKNSQEPENQNSSSDSTSTEIGSQNNKDGFEGQQSSEKNQTTSTSDKTDSSNETSDKANGSGDEDGDKNTDVDLSSIIAQDRKRAINRTKTLAKAAKQKAKQANKGEQIQAELDNIIDKLDKIKASDIADENSTVVEDLIDQAVEVLNKVVKIKPSTDIDRRAKKINQLEKDPFAQMELDREDKINIESQPNRARWKFNQQSLQYSYGDMENFKIDLSGVCKLQLKKSENEVDMMDGSTAVNDDEDQIRRVYFDEENLDNEKPLFQVYLDTSGSFNDEDLDRLNDLVAILNTYEQEELLDFETYYFADNIHLNDKAAARVEGTTAAWPHIYANIIKTKPTNVIIATDHDLQEYENKNFKTLELSGAVFWIWKGTNSADLCKYLHGALQNKQYKL